jgi:hypothetical protein
MNHHNISNQSFADDTQLYDSSPPDQITATVQHMQKCISDVKQWMTANKLKLNDDNTEALLVASKTKPVPPHSPTSIFVGDSSICFSSKATNLGVTIKKLFIIRRTCFKYMQIGIP